MGSKNNLDYRNKRLNVSLHFIVPHRFYGAKHTKRRARLVPNNNYSKRCDCKHIMFPLEELSQISTKDLLIYS
jgi:hypothetical protein